MKELNINITSVEVKAKTRKLRAKWTPEMAKEIKYHASIDPYELDEIYMKELRRSNRRNSINNIFKK